ncbi:hypothetical protein [Natronococcus sp.]|uniref:hypothetical protein n=1 Tax=Natronococcus sp. TaxID=35747 RepID=UPI003A4DD07A
MSAMRSTTPATAFAERWDNHVSRMWFERSRTPWRDPRGAFDQATEVHYPSAGPESTAYYDPDGDVVFVEYAGDVRTCIALSDRPESEQTYVRDQLEAQR